jgi:ribosomal-protein-alanine N-acetyltransferase
MSPLLRPIGPFDLEIVAALHAASFEEAWSVQAIGELLAMPGAFGIMACLPGPQGPRPAGFLLSIGIDPQLRRQGLAKLLMDGASAHAAAVGARRMFLEVAEDNWGARRLYASLGFAPVGRRRNYYRRGQNFVAALTMRRLLPAWRGPYR